MEKTRMDLAQLINTVGFPVAMSIYFIYQNRQQSEKYIELLRTSISTIDKFNSALDRVERVLEERIKGNVWNVDYYIFSHNLTASDSFDKLAPFQ